MVAMRLLLDLLVPPRCPACGRPATATWCGRCLGELAGLALPDQGRTELAPGVRSLAAYAYDGVARATVLDAKVRGRAGALAGMGALLRARLELPPPAPGLAVTWVPSDRRRVRARGVDLPRALAGPGAVPLLRRVRSTHDQKGLAAGARRRNVIGAFVARGAVPPAVVLVDDVRTTGATALAAATALRDAGARRVLVAAFAAVSAECVPSGRSPPEAGRDAAGTGRWSSPPRARTAAPP